MIYRTIVKTIQIEIGDKCWVALNPTGPDPDLKSDRCIYYKTVGAKFCWGRGGGHAPSENFVLTNSLSCILLHSDV